MGAAKYKVIAIFWGSFDLAVTRWLGNRPMRLRDA
jgi:hypothetical protein